jgi:hypothetical protein
MVNDNKDRSDLVRRLAELNRTTRDLIAQSEKTLRDAEGVAHSVSELEMKHAPKPTTE